MLVVLLLLALCTITDATEQVDEGNTALTMIPGDANLLWKFNDDRTEITFTITADIEDQWIALGLSSSGGMKWAEHFICNPVDGTLKHGWSGAYATPTIMEESYSGLEQASVDDGTSTCRFTIPTESCLGSEYDIKPYTTRIIYAVGDASSFVYHGDKRGYKQINMNIDESEIEMPLPSEDEIGNTIHEWNIDIEDIELPANKLNAYYCVIATHPEAANYKAGVADEEADYPETSWIVNGHYHTMSTYVHHMFIWSCPKDFTYNLATEAEHAEGEVFECESKMYDQCVNIIGGWAPGTEYGARANAGYAINGQADWSTMIVQVHYNNPNLHAEVIDSARMTFYYTHEQPDIQTWWYAAGVHQKALQIPAGQKYYRATSTTAPACTESWDPQYITDYAFHMHGAGSRARLSLIRDGQEHFVFMDSAYDYDFQTAFKVDPPLEILPGDSIYVECTFDTENRDEWTYGGDYTESEMCYTFITFGPKWHDGDSHVCFVLNDPLAPEVLRCENMSGDEDCVNWGYEYWVNPGHPEDGFAVTDLSYRDFEFQPQREPTCDFEIPAEILDYNENVKAWQALNVTERLEFAFDSSVEETQEDSSVDETQEDSGDSENNTASLVMIVVVVVGGVIIIGGFWMMNRKNAKEIEGANDGSQDMKLVVNGETKRQPGSSQVGGSTM